MLHFKLLTDIALQLNLHIISIDSNGASVKFQVQMAVQKFCTLDWFLVYYKEYEVDFNCPIFPNIRPVIQVQDSNHGKKTAWNICMSDARLLSFRDSIVYYE